QACLVAVAPDAPAVLGPEEHAIGRLIAEQLDGKADQLAVAKVRMRIEAGTSGPPGGIKFFFLGVLCRAAKPGISPRRKKPRNFRGSSVTYFLRRCKQASRASRVKSSLPLPGMALRRPRFTRL